MLGIPLTPVPSQTMSITLAGQPANIAVYQREDNLYFDLKVNGTDIVLTRICRNLQPLLVDMQYQPFVGDFVFVDTEKDEQPEYLGLGSRWQLIYLEPADLEQ